MADSKRELHNILEKMNIVHRKDMTDVVAGHLNENYVFKADWKSWNSKNIEPKWSTSSKKKSERVKKKSVLSRLPPLEQNVKIMTDTMAGFSLGFDASEFPNLPTSPSQKKDQSFSPSFPLSPRERYRYMDHLPFAVPNICPAKIKQYRQGQKAKKNIINGNTNFPDNAEMKRITGRIERNIRKRLASLSETHDISKASFFRWKIFSDAWNEVIESSETFQGMISAIKSDYDNYINSLLDAQSEEPKLIEDEIQVFATYDVDRKEIYEKGKRIKKLEEEIIKEFEINKRLQEELKNPILTPVDSTDDFQVIIGEIPKEEIVHSIFSDVGNRNIEKEVQILHVEIEMQLNTLKNLKRDQKENYVSQSLCEQLEHCIKEAEVDIQKLYKQNEYLERNLEELEEELENVLLKTGIKEKDAKLLWNKIYKSRVVDIG